MYRKINDTINAKDVDNYKDNDIDKLVLKKNIKSAEDELLRKTFYIRRKNWDKLCETATRTHNSKLKVLNSLLEYAFEKLVIE